MRVVRPPVGTRLAAVVEVPRGPLRVDPERGPPIRLSLIVPTYNESRNLEELLRQLTAVLEPRLSGEYEIVVVDDDSPDGTWAVAMRLAERWPAVRVMRRRSEKGLSTAVIRGWQVARGEVLAVIDADLQHPPEVLARLWEAVKAGADLAVASRRAEGGGVSDWADYRQDRQIRGLQEEVNAAYQYANHRSRTPVEMRFGLAPAARSSTSAAHARNRSPPPAAA